MAGLSAPGPDRPRNGIFPTANKHPSDSNMVEFVVTLKSKDDLTAFYNDMEDTSSITNLPDRKCECRVRRQLSRNTHYWLTRAEATALVNDSRVEAVEEPPEARGAWKDIDAWTQTSSKFSKDTISDPDDINWGIVRMREKTNPANWGSPGTGSDSYDITRTIVSELSGKNVDVVVMDDGGPFPNTLEYAANADGTGVSRMIRRNWDDGRANYLLGGDDYPGTNVAADSNRTAGTYTNIQPTGGSGSGLIVDVEVDSNGAVGYTTGQGGSVTVKDNAASYGNLFKGGENYREGDLVTIPDSALGGGGGADLVLHVQIGFYNYHASSHKKQEHGAHCTGNAAGNTQGWARDSNIYNLSFYDDPQYVLKFHKEKPVNPETGRPNPTVMNNSWGYRDGTWGYYKYRTKQIIYRGNNYFPITAGGLYTWGSWSNIGAQGNRTAGTYTVSPTGGTGSGAKFEVEVKSDGSIDRFSYEKVKYDKPGANFGSGYTANDSLTIPDSQLGGGGAPDVTFTVTAVSDDGTNNRAIWSDQTCDTVKMGTGSLPTRNAAVDADYADLVNGGVVVIASAGNSDFYIADGPADPDWDNRFIDKNNTSYYYHRGSSPGSARGSNGERVITIGAMGAHNDTDLYKTGGAVSITKTTGIEKTDYRAEFSNFGPGIVVWAPGCAIQSTWRGDQPYYQPTSVINGGLDPRVAALGIRPSLFNHFFKLAGTSMSGPNACGMFACLAERYPNMTTKTAIQYVKDFCPDTVETTNNGFAVGAYGNHPTYNNYYVSNRTDDTDLGYAYNNASCRAHAYLVNHRNTETGGQAYPSHDSLVRTDSGTFASHKVTYPRKTTKIRSNPPYTYALSKSGPDKLHNETETTITLTTTNVPDGTKVPYVITSDYKDIGVRPFMYQNLGLMQIHDSTLSHSLDWNQPFTGMHHKKGKQWKINIASAATPTAVDDTANLIPTIEFSSSYNTQSFSSVGGTHDYGTAANGGISLGIPWSIPIFGTNQTVTHWSINGFVTFGSTAEIDANNALDVPNDIIFFNGFAGACEGYSLLWELTGTAPNRVLTVEWWGAYAGISISVDTYWTFKENDKDHIYVKYDGLTPYMTGDKDETSMWPTFAYGPQRDFYFDENDGYFTINNNTATTKLKKQFPITVDNFNLILKLAHFGGEQITIPTDSSYTFRFYIDNYIQNTTGNMQGYSGWRYLNQNNSLGRTGCEDRRHQWTRKYSTNPFSSRNGRTIWMRVGDTMIMKTTGGAGTGTIRLSETIGGPQSPLVSNSSQDAYTFTPVTAGELWLCEPSQGTIHDAIRVFVYGKYEVTFTAANTTNGYKSSGRDVGGSFVDVDDRDILLSVGDTLVINNQVSGAHPIRISTSDVNTSPVAPEVTSETQSAYTFTPPTYGIWYYNCTAHNGMGGRIIVTYDKFKYQEEVSDTRTDIDLTPVSGSHWQLGQTTANSMYFDGKVYQKQHTQKPFRMTIGDFFRFDNKDYSNHPIIISDTSNGFESRDVVSNWQGNYWFAPQRIGSYFLRSTGSNPPPEMELTCELPLYCNHIE